jgi:hypothetical protein
MLKHIGSVTAAATLVIAVCLAGPALAQAPLGLSIDPHEGFPGDVVEGMVNTDDVAASCVTDLAEFQARFNDLTFNVLAFFAPDPLWLRFFPADVTDILTTIETHDQLAYTLTLLVVVGIAANEGGAAEDALPQTFVMTFADIFTQEPVGEMGNFDPDTGLGSVVVPDVDPGLWAVAATCVGPSFDRDTLEAGIRSSGAFLEQIGAPAVSPIDQEFLDWAQGFLGTDTTGFDLLLELLTAIGPDLLEPIVVPDALGIQLFTVLAHLGHFQCYRAHPAVGVCAGTAGSTIPEQLPVTLADQFGVYSGTAHRPVDLCAPADKNGEDAEAPSSLDFLTSYKLSVPGPVVHIPGVQVVNQFGTITLDLLQPDALLVPTAVSLTCSPPAPGESFLNDFTCYSVQVGKTQGKGAPKPGSVLVTTAFEGPVAITPGNPQHLCVPASKNGGPVIASSPEDLLCYDVKSGVGPGPAPIVSIANQFGQETRSIGQRRELCVPSDKIE